MELIKITKSQGGKEVVSARELYSFLSSNGFNVTRWMTLNIENNTFAVQSVDYQRIMRRAENNRSIEDYALTINFAKKLAMIANTDKGNEVRDYFIECENKLHQKSQLPQTFAQALRLAATQAEQLELQAPKVNFADTVIKSDENISMANMAKLIGIGRNKLFSILRDKKVLMSNGGYKNTPYQKHVDAGHFVVTEKFSARGGFCFVVPLVTPKGQVYITNKLKK